MTTRVGIRELKAKLSHYLDRAEAGETIVVTDRGRAKVEIRMLSVEERLAQLASEGRVTPARETRRREVVPLRLKGRMTVDEVLREDRGE